MPTIQEALLKKGLISEESFEEQKRKKESAQNGPKAKVQSYDIDGCTTINGFKQTAKMILQEKPEEIQTLIQKAHEKFDKSVSGFKKLMWILYSVKNNSNGLAGDRYQKLLNRAFRKAGADPNISENL